jgi:hypothetical protein
MELNRSAMVDNRSRRMGMNHRIIMTMWLNKTILGLSLMGTILFVSSTSVIYGQLPNGTIITAPYPVLDNETINQALVNGTSYLKEFQSFNDGCAYLGENEGVLNECALVYQEFTRLMGQLHDKHGDIIMKYVMAEGEVQEFLGGGVFPE